MQKIKINALRAYVPNSSEKRYEFIIPALTDKKTKSVITEKKENKRELNL